MAQLTHEEYERLEHAVSRGQRIAVYRRGTEFVVTPLSLVQRGGREVIEARNPTTGDSLSLFLDELESIEVVGGTR
ncbi:MAG TPA: hypothetical protein VKH19_15710 [Gemmatimonadaceae bacterium]|nr:hypothetical protein [Gemmatimonadaceae bacterium]